MYLEHLNLVVKDIPQTLKFYQAAFPHWKIRGGDKMTWHGVTRNWIHFGDDNYYLTFNDKGTGNNRVLSSNELGLCHFAFVTKHLTSLIERLQHAGFTIESEGASTPFRNNVYFIDPNGYEVEFVEYLSDNPSDRNIYEMKGAD